MNAKKYKAFLVSELRKYMKGEQLEKMSDALDIFKHKILIDKDMESEDDKREELTINAVIKHICLYYNTTKKELYSGYRGQKIANKRHILLYCCLQYIDMFVEDIGWKTPGRNHSKLYYARDRCLNPFELYDDYNKFIKYLNTKYKLKLIKR